MLSFQRNNFMCDDIYICDIYHIGKRNFLFLLSLNLSLRCECARHICTCVWYLLYCACVLACLACLLHRSQLTTMSMCRRKNNTFECASTHFSFYQIIFLRIRWFICALCYYLPFAWHNGITDIHMHACVIFNCMTHGVNVKPKAALICLPPISLLFCHEKWFNCVTKTNIVIQC